MERVQRVGEVGGRSGGMGVEGGRGGGTHSLRMLSILSGCPASAECTLGSECVWPHTLSSTSVLPTPAHTKCIHIRHHHTKFKEIIYEHMFC